MKKILFPLIVLLLMACVGKSRNTTQLATDKEINNGCSANESSLAVAGQGIRKATRKDYRVDNQKNKSYVGRIEWLFDAQGDTLSEIHYNVEGDAQHKIIYTYDSLGHRLTETASGFSEYRTEWTYDSLGHRQTETSYDSRGKKGASKVYTYDTLGHPQVTIHYIANGFANVKNIYTFDGTQSLLSEIWYMQSDDCVAWKQIFTYDSIGHPLSMSYKSNTGEQVRETWTYDNHGNCLEHVSYDSDGTIDRKWIYTYDDHGNCLSQTAYKVNDWIDYKEEYTYYSSGLIRSRTYALGENSYHAYSEWEYEYWE